jgi:hypothetical protein
MARECRVVGRRTDGSGLDIECEYNGAVLLSDDLARCGLPSSHSPTTVLGRDGNLLSVLLYPVGGPANSLLMLSKW